MLQVVVPIVIVLGVIISVVYGYRRYKRKEHFEKYDLFVNFILALLAIFAGALLAFQLSNLQNERTEKEALVALISSTVNELNDELFTINELQAELKGVDHKLAELALNKNEISDIIGLNVLLTYHPLPKYFSSFGMTVLQGLTRYKEKTRHILNNPDEDLSIRLNFFTTYREHLEDLRNLMLIQMEYVQGKISDDEATERMEKSLHYVIPGKSKLIWK